ncbi:MAG: formylglycine-generating enzyme family protein, partial [Thiohalomonadales bacterium]
MNRMNQMRSLAGIDLKDEEKHIRGAGEEIFRHTEHEYNLTENKSYTKDEAEALLTQEQWRQLAVMIEIPAGEFIQGSDNKKTDDHNKPAHTVQLRAYRIDKYPVTNAEYARFVAATEYIPPLDWKGGHIPPGKELHPVTMVSYFNAQKYAEWAGKRLPTEQEWEKAARGKDGRRWPWGEKMDPTRLNTYYTVGSTTKVGSYKRGVSPYGIYDMAGNVSEWTDSNFLPYQGTNANTRTFQAKEAQIPATGAERSMRVADFVATEKRYKVMRGGSWKSDPFSNSTYHRNYAWPNAASDFFGFRTVRDIEQQVKK